MCTNYIRYLIVVHSYNISLALCTYTLTRNCYCNGVVTHFVRSIIKHMNNVNYIYSRLPANTTYTSHNRCSLCTITSHFGNTIVSTHMYIVYACMPCMNTTRGSTCK